MKRKTMAASAMGGVFALTAFTPLVSHAFGDGKCGATMMEYKMVDADADGQISKNELMTHVETMFDNMDSDGSGGVSNLEWLFAGHKSDRH